jgi:signal transduction histidine kinase
MKETETPNGSTSVILLRLRIIEDAQDDMKRTLKEVRDHQLMHHPCPSPGKCLSLESALTALSDDIKEESATTDKRLKRLERREAWIVGWSVCASSVIGVVLMLVKSFWR